jgi:hypothetical protein
LLFSRIKAQTVSGVVSDYFSKRPLDGRNGTKRVPDIIPSAIHWAGMQLMYDDPTPFWFSYLNKQTMKYPVDTSQHPQELRCCLICRCQMVTLVKVAPAITGTIQYKNRLEYAKVFNVRKPG